MTDKRIFREIELAALAKKLRQKSGKKKAVLARELGVTRATMQDAEERPEVSLTKLRRRIIEACSPFEVHGPVFWLKRKPGNQTAQSTPSSSSTPLGGDQVPVANVWRGFERERVWQLIVKRAVLNGFGSVNAANGVRTDHIINRSSDLQSGAIPGSRMT